VTQYDTRSTMHFVQARYRKQEENIKKTRIICRYCRQRRVLLTAKMTMHCTIAAPATTVQKHRYNTTCNLRYEYWNSTL